MFDTKFTCHNFVESLCCHMAHSSYQCRWHFELLVQPMIHKTNFITCRMCTNCYFLILKGSGLVLLDVWTSSVRWYSEQTAFQKLDLLPCLGGKVRNLLSPLKEVMSVRCLPTFWCSNGMDLVPAVCSFQNSTVDIVPMPSNNTPYSDLFFWLHYPHHNLYFT